MRYKQMVLNKLEQLDILTNRVTLDINHNNTKDNILESLTLIKEQIGDITSDISSENDDLDR